MWCVVVRDAWCKLDVGGGAAEAEGAVEVGGERSEQSAEGDSWRTAMMVGLGVARSRMLDTMAEWSKALVLGTSLRAWVRIPLVSLFH